ncbi:MAG: hypothetical protein ACTHK1_14610 [Actinomycetales bacterium]
MEHFHEFETAVDVLLALTPDQQRVYLQQRFAATDPLQPQQRLTLPWGPATLAAAVEAQH